MPHIRLEKEYFAKIINCSLGKTALIKFMGVYYREKAEILRSQDAGGNNYQGQ
jgi:hypothetical protein